MRVAYPGKGEGQSAVSSQQSAVGSMHTSRRKIPSAENIFQCGGYPPPGELIIRGARPACRPETSAQLASLRLGAMGQVEMRFPLNRVVFNGENTLLF